MAASRSMDRMIQDLTQDLRPVRPLRAPAIRAASWLGAVVALGLGIAPFAPLAEVTRRLSATPDMTLAIVGSAFTAALGALAVFQLSLPDRRATWALLPLPGLALWIGASGLGCLRPWLIPGTHDASLAESRDCLVFILGFSVPLSALMIVMIRRAFPLRPHLAASLAGLSCAAAAATLLNLVHPYDASASDLVVHFFAVAVVIGVHRLLAGRVVRP